MTSLLPAFTHIVNPKLKYIYLSFNHEGDLLIKSPKVSQREIEKVLIKKAAWITKSRQRLLEKKGKPLQFREGEELFFLGNSYPVHYRSWERKRSRLHFEEGEGFRINYSDFDPEYFEGIVNLFYKQKAQDLIPGIVQQYAEEMNLFPSKISFRKARRRWGSCSSNNAISLNYLMMKLPLPVIQYIIVHELAHIRHKHHQKAFWNLVGQYLPDYKIRQSELKCYM